jgi:micrococcal nuclease
VRRPRGSQRLLLLVVAIGVLVAAGCGSSESDEPVIAASDEEALLEDAQEHAQAFEPDADGEAPLEADAVDEVVPDGELVVVDFVPDGDTVQLDDGRRVRLVQLDSPEGGEGEECYADEARDTLRAFIDQGTEILLVADPLLDQEDRFGRLLRYVVVDGENVNVELVRRGAATVWFFDGEEGIFATELLEAATLANENKTGLWGACPDTPFDPRHGADTGPA